MFESLFLKLVDDVLNSILGECLENFDRRNVSLSLWSGHASLTDLKLRRDLFQRLGLPFQTKLGIIKRLDLEVPYMRLSSQPVVAKLDQIFLVIQP